jgi:co-chaperonin GroES (HSP10)
MKLNSYKPLWRQVVLSPLKEDKLVKTTSGIYVPKEQNEQPVFEVLAIGKECIEIKVGDKVLLTHEIMKTPITCEDKQDVYQVMEQQIIGVIK